MLWDILTYIWINIGSNNGLLPDGIRLLLKDDVDWTSKVFRSIRMRTILHINLIRNTWSEMPVLKSYLYVTRANELNIYMVQFYQSQHQG